MSFFIYFLDRSVMNVLTINFTKTGNRGQENELTFNELLLMCHALYLIRLIS